MPCQYIWRDKTNISDNTLKVITYTFLKLNTVGNNIIER